MVTIAQQQQQPQEVYTVAELMARWKLSRRVVTRLFEQEAGVLKIGHPETRFKRRHYTLRIPAAVAERVWRRLAS